MGFFYIHKQKEYCRSTDYRNCCLLSMKKPLDIFLSFYWLEEISLLPLSFPVTSFYYSWHHFLISKQFLSLVHIYLFDCQVILCGIFPPEFLFTYLFIYFTNDWWLFSTLNTAYWDQGCIQILLNKRPFPFPLHFSLNSNEKLHIDQGNVTGGFRSYLEICFRIIICSFNTWWPWQWFMMTRLIQQEN